VSLLLWACSVASTLWIIATEANFRSQALVYTKELIIPGTLLWCLTVVVNILTTGLLVWRIWSVDRSNKRHGIQDSGSGQSTLTRVIRIIVESGLIYTVSAFISFVTYVTGNNTIYIITGVDIQTVGIAFNLIIIRASHLSKQQSSVSAFTLTDMDTGQTRFTASSVN